MQQLFTLLNPIYIGPVPVILLRDLAALVKDTEYWLANIPDAICVDAEYKGNRTRISLLAANGVNQYLEYRGLTVDDVLTNMREPDIFPCTNPQSVVTEFITTPGFAQWDRCACAQVYIKFKQQYPDSTLLCHEFYHTLIEIGAALKATHDGRYVYLFPSLNAGPVMDKLREFISAGICKQSKFAIDYLFDTLSKLRPGLVPDVIVLGSVLNANDLMLVRWDYCESLL